MRSVLAALWDWAGLRQVADPEDYDPDEVMHTADDAEGQPGGVAYCGYIFLEPSVFDRVLPRGRFAALCPDCVDVLGYVPGEGPPEDELDVVDDEWEGTA